MVPLERDLLLAIWLLPTCFGEGVTGGGTDAQVPPLGTDGVELALSMKAFLVEPMWGLSITRDTKKRQN